MSQVNAVRRALAKIRHDEDGIAIPQIGHREVHQFWPMLSDCFRDVLLAPHERTDEDAVSWTWREAEVAAPPSAEELAGLRQRLAVALDRFSGDVAGGRVGRGSGSLAPWQAVGVEQLEAVMSDVVRELKARSDADLATYVCRTEGGLRLHSWGAARPALPTYPDLHGLEIAGRVLVAGKPARHDVVLESSDGETIAEVPSDEDGEFSFSKLSPGEYRLRARSVRGTFPPHGLPVDLQQRSVKGLVLADARADTVSPLVSARRTAGRRSRRSVPLLAFGVLAAAGGWWGWRSWQASVPGTPVPMEPRVASTAGGEASSPAELPLTARSDAPAGLTAATLPGDAGTGAAPSAAIDPAVAMARREILTAGREAEPGVFLPGSSGGGSRGGGAQPPTGGAGDVSAVGAKPVSTDNVQGAAPAVSAPVVASAGAAPAGRPEETAPTPAAAPGGNGAMPAPAAPGLGSRSPSAGGSEAAVAMTPPVVAARTEAPAEPTAGESAVAPQAPADSSAGTTGVSAAEADFATPRAENAREPAGNLVASGSASVTPRDNASVPAGPADAAPPDARTVPVPLPSAAPAPVGPQPGLTRAAPVILTRTVRVRVSPWRTRLLADTILPTEPIPLTRSEPVAVLRARLLAEKEARLPQALRDPRDRWGVALDLGGEGGDEPLTWVDADGGRPEGANVAGGRAEITWAPGFDGGERLFQLARRDGSLIAEVRVAANGRDFSVRTTEEAGAWLLVAVDVGLSSRATLAATAVAPPFAWRTVSADSLPSGWRARDGAAAPNEVVAEVPLGRLAGAAALQTGALFDPETGWAIVCDIRQAADRPLGN